MPRSDWRGSWNRGWRRGLSTRVAVAVGRVRGHARGESGFQLEFIRSKNRQATLSLPPPAAVRSVKRMRERLGHPRRKVAASLLLLLPFLILSFSRFSIRECASSSASFTAATAPSRSRNHPRPGLSLASSQQDDTWCLRENCDSRFGRFSYFIFFITFALCLYCAIVALLYVITFLGQSETFISLFMSKRNKQILP